ncbi:hypothetical protein CL620_01240 [archaeon]|nr:hypothetical protein [archaeon]
MLQEIVEQIVEQYHASVIILVGSRYVGDHTSTSDWDFFVLTPKLKKGHDRLDVYEQYGFPDREGEDIDITFLPVSAKFDYEKYGKKLRYAKVVFDSKGIGKQIMKEAIEYYKKGPKKWSITEKELERRRSLRYIGKMNELLQKKKYDHLLWRLSFYYTERLIPWWFWNKGEWQLRPQEAFSYIKKKDPTYYRTLQKIFGETSYKIKISACEKLHVILFGD